MREANSGIFIQRRGIAIIDENFPRWSQIARMTNLLVKSLQTAISIDLFSLMMMANITDEELYTFCWTTPNL